MPGHHRFLESYEEDDWIPGVCVCVCVCVCAWKCVRGSVCVCVEVFGGVDVWRCRVCGGVGWVGVGAGQPEGL